MAINKDIILLDTDKTKLYPLAHKDSGNNVIVDTYVKKAGDTMTGTLIIEGSAASNPLIVRGISGSDGNGNLGDLFLNRNGGVTYFGTSGGGHITADGKSYSGNAATATKATQDGDGNTISTTYVKEAGDTMTGSLSFSNADIGVQRVGRSKSWHKGRDGALVKATSLSGYSPTISTKTNNGSWEIGAYDNSSYTDDLVFSYVKDTDYTNNTNAHTEIKFLENGSIVANLQGDVTGNVTGSSSLNVLKAGDTMFGNLFFANTNNTTTSGSTPLGIYGSVGDNDGWRIVGLGSSNAGSLEIATNDDGNEPIYVRQYNGGGGSAGFVTIARTLTLLDDSGNTTIPGSLNLSSTADAAGGTAGSPPLIIGTPTGQHLEIDNNEILSKSNGTTPSILYLQDSTGGVVVAGSGGLSVNNGNLSVSGSITSTGAISATAGSIWAGTDGNTAAERDLGVQSGAGRIYLYSAASTTGTRGIWLAAHGTDTSGKNVFSVDTNNNTTFYGYLSGTAGTANNIKIASGTTSKEYLVGVPAYSASNQVPYINQYCFMQSNYLYSGGNKVEGCSSAVWSGKKTSSGSDSGTTITNLALFHRARIYAVYKSNGIAIWEVDNSKIVSLNKECEVNHTELSYMAWDGGSGYYQTFFKVSLTPSGNNMILKFTEVRNFSVPYTGSTGTSQTGNGDYYIYQVDGIN